MRSEVTAEVLEKVARRLGWASLWFDDATGAFWARYGLGQNEEIISHGDLLLVILNRAAKMGFIWQLRDGFVIDKCECSFRCGGVQYGAEGATPLEAAMLAFAQLPESP